MIFLNFRDERPTFGKLFSNSLFSSMPWEMLSRLQDGFSNFLYHFYIGYKSSSLGRIRKKMVDENQVITCYTVEAYENGILTTILHFYFCVWVCIVVKRAFVKN